jgi:hypothetical protein
LQRKSEAKGGTGPTGTPRRLKAALEIVPIEEIVYIAKQSQASLLSQREFVTRAKIGFD